MSIRETAVAGQFYPADSKEIDQMIAHYNSVLDEHIKNEEILSKVPRAVIVPHAGYVYSGFTANIAFRLLANNRNLKSVVIIGPSHRVYVAGTSVADFDSYQTPMGVMPVNRELVERLKSEFGLSFNPEAHHEHSTEVQMPFIKEYLENVSVVELVYGAEEPANLAKVITELLNDPAIGIVISTDLSHFHTQQEAKSMDDLCIQAMVDLNISELENGCEACGMIGVKAIIALANQEAMKSQILDYRTSADVTGDKARVVGYVSCLIG